MSKTCYTIDELLPKAGYSVYRLVRMASKRANELSDGKKCLIENPESEKETSRALEEISQGKVVCKDNEDLLAPEKILPFTSDDEIETELEKTEV